MLCGLRTFGDLAIKWTLPLSRKQYQLVFVKSNNSCPFSKSSLEYQSQAGVGGLPVLGSGFLGETGYPSGGR